MNRFLYIIEVCIVSIAIIMLLFMYVSSVNFHLTKYSYPLFLLAFGLGMLLREILS